MKKYKIELGGQGLLHAVDVIKIVDNDDKAAKHSERKEYFAALPSLSKISISLIAVGLAAQFDFTCFSSRPFLVLGRHFFYTKGVLFEQEYIIII